MNQTERCIEFAGWIAKNYWHDPNNENPIIYLSRKSNLEDKEEYLQDYTVDQLYDLWLREKTVEILEELWDNHSEYIDSDLFSLETVAGTSVIKRDDFMMAGIKLMQKFFIF